MWEPISDVKPHGTDLRLESQRVKVQGGWVIRTLTSRYHAGTVSHQVFVSDPGHEWEIETQE